MNRKIAIVIPACNEADNIGALLTEVAQATAGLPVEELIVVDDGSTDQTAEAVRAARARDPRVRLIRHTVRSGQSAGLRTGIEQARSEVIVTLDGDGQNDPADIPAMIADYEAAADKATGPVLVAGQRRRRQDSLTKRLSSKLANRIRSWMLKDGVRDTGCALKVFGRDAFLRLPYFNHMHRYLPALFIRDGGTIVLRDVGHRHRMQGRSNYGTLDRLLAGLIDLPAVAWLMLRARPKTQITEE